MQGSGTIGVERLDELIAAIFADEQVAVYSAYSEYGEDIRKFTKPSDLAEYAESVLDSNKGLLNLAVQYPGSGPTAQIRKISLNPEKCHGDSFRYSADGWGLIHIQCTATKDHDLKCRVAVNSEKRAFKWFDTYPELGDPEKWDWAVVERHARRLVRVVKKLES